MRTRLLKPSVQLPMGQYTVSITHLRHVLATESRLAHDLTETDLDSTDKMNFRAVTRMTSDAVLELVRKQKDGVATEAYLQLMRDVMHSFLDEDVPAESCITLLWRVTFFLRIWRRWLEMEGYSTDANFITWNIFVCIEISAHSLISIIRQLRDEGRPDLFLPSLFSSQPCEAFFRDTRSLTATNSTVVNFSIQELLRRRGRIELQSVVANQIDSEFAFPRETRRQAAGNLRRETLLETVLPSDWTILECVAQARREAEDLARWLGIDEAETPDFPDCLKSERIRIQHEEDDSDDEADEVEPLPEDVDVGDIAVMMAAESVSAPSAEEPPSGPQCRPSAPSRSFTVYTASNGVQVVVRKSSLCLRLSKRTKLSADRLIRVQEGRDKVAGTAEQPEAVLRSDTVAVSQWCVFKHSSQAKEGEAVVGRVLAFKYLAGRTEAARQYPGESAPVQSPSLGCLCSWFSVDGEGNVQYLPADHALRPLNWYLFTVPPPRVMGSNRVLYSEFIAKSIINAV